MEYLALVVLVVVNGIFAMSEIALVSARKGRLQQKANLGSSGARKALKLGEDPTTFLSTVQIGITSIGILNGIVGESMLAAPMADWLLSMGVVVTVARPLATVLVVVGVTYLSIVIGELVPKRLGQLFPDTIATVVAPPMWILSLITRPFVMLLSGSTHLLLRLVGIRHRGPAVVTVEEIHAMLDEGSAAGVIEKQEHTMVRNVFGLDDRSLGSLLVPRSDIVFLDLTNNFSDNLHKAMECGHSRFPLCNGNPDNLLGVVAAKDLLLAAARGDTPDLSTLVQPCIYVPESLSAMELVEKFRINNTRMIFVIDEFGGLEGLVTLHDLFETVMGDFPESMGAESEAVEREDGSWLLDGSMAILEVSQLLHWRSLPEEDKGHYHTLGGLIMLLMGNIPRTGDVSTWDGWKLEVVDMDGKRVDKVLACRDTASLPSKN